MAPFTSLFCKDAILSAVVGRTGCHAKISLCRPLAFAGRVNPQEYEEQDGESPQR